MGRIILSAIAAALCVVVSHIPISSAASPEVNAEILATLQFPVPESAKASEYLGLSGSEPFKLNDIKGDIIIVEIFSMYCPYCQAEAPNINKLFALIEQHPSMKTKAKLLGVGSGNTAYEVEVFRKKFGIPFPLIPDEKFSIDRCSERRFMTPTFIVLRRDQKKLKVLKVHEGKIERVDEFLESIAKL